MNFKRKKLEDTQKQTYNLNEIFKKFDSRKEKPITLQELKEEINLLKIEIENLKQKQKENSLILNQWINQNKTEEKEFLSTISKNFNQKWFAKISPNFRINPIAIFDTGAFLNCIREGTIPTNILKKQKKN